MTVKKQSKQKRIFRSARSAVQNTVVFQGSPPFAVHWIHFAGSVLASTFVRRSLISWQARSVCISHVVSVFDAICWSGRQMPQLAWSPSSYVVLWTVESRCAAPPLSSPALPPVTLSHGCTQLCNLSILLRVAARIVNVVGFFRICRALCCRSTRLDIGFRSFCCT